MDRRVGVGVRVRAGGQRVAIPRLFVVVWSQQQTFELKGPVALGERGRLVHQALDDSLGLLVIVVGTCFVEFRILTDGLW